MRRRGVVFALTFMWAACASSTVSPDDAAVSPTEDAAVAIVDAAIGAPDAAAARTGATATGTVSGSVKASSPNYKLIGTVNAGTRNSQSPEYKKRGGIVGATQP